MCCVSASLLYTPHTTVVGGGDSSTTINLMTNGMLGAFEDDGWEGYACSFGAWTACVNSTASIDSCNNDPNSPCKKCASRPPSDRSRQSTTITCSESATRKGQIVFNFPAGAIFPVVEQFTIPANAAIVGAANPNNDSDKAAQQVAIADQTWFVVPASNTLCGQDPQCKDHTAKGPTACSGDPRSV